MGVMTHKANLYEIPNALMIWLKYQYILYNWYLNSFRFWIIKANLKHNTEKYFAS